MNRQKERIGRGWEWIDALSSAVGRATGFLVIVIALLGAGNAVARYISRFTDVSLSSNAWLELQWYLFAIIFLLGAAVTLRDNAHVRVDVLFHRLSPRARAWIDLCGAALFLIPFCVIMIWVCWNPTHSSWAIREMSPDPGGLPRWPIKMAVPIAFALLLLQALANLARTVAVLRHGGEQPNESKS